MVTISSLTHSVHRKYTNPRENIPMENIGNFCPTILNYTMLVCINRIRQYEKNFSWKFMTLDFLAMNLEARSFSCFVWTGTLEALMSETNKCLAKKAKRNIDVGYPLRDAEAS
ncbi:Methyltransferase-like protein, partial [Daphnia magna]